METVTIEQLFGLVCGTVLAFLCVSVLVLMAIDRPRVIAWFHETFVRVEEAPPWAYKAINDLTAKNRREYAPIMFDRWNKNGGIFTLGDYHFLQDHHQKIADKKVVDDCVEFVKKSVTYEVPQDIMTKPFGPGILGYLKNEAELHKKLFDDALCDLYAKHGCTPVFYNLPKSSPIDSQKTLLPNVPVLNLTIGSKGVDLLKYLAEVDDYLKGMNRFLVSKGFDSSTQA